MGHYSTYFETHKGLSLSALFYTAPGYPLAWMNQKPAGTLRKKEAKLPPCLPIIGLMYQKRPPENGIQGQWHFQRLSSCCCCCCKWLNGLPLPVIKTSSLVTNSIIFRWLSTIKGWCKKCFFTVSLFISSSGSNARVDFPWRALRCQLIKSFMGPKLKWENYFPIYLPPIQINDLLSCK